MMWTAEVVSLVADQVRAMYQSDGFSVVVRLGMYHHDPEAVAEVSICAFEVRGVGITGRPACCSVSSLR